MHSDAPLAGNGPRVGAPAAQGVQMSPPQYPGPWGTLIGYSWYDLMTNNGTYDRTQHDEASNTVSATWTLSCSQPAAATPKEYLSRGAGYNYLDGTTWVNGSNGNCPSQFGVTTLRTGFPNLNLVAGQEMIFAHSAGITLTQRPKGTGPWSATTRIPFTVDINGLAAADGTWSRTIASGNIVHMLYATGSTGGVTASSDPRDTISHVISPMFYSRSTNGGATWDRQNVLLPGMDTTNYGTDYYAGDNTNPAGQYGGLGGDSYAIATNGNYVSIVAGSFSRAFMVWMSNDNGTTWTNKIIAAQRFSGNAPVYVQDPLSPQGIADKVSFRTLGQFDVSVDNNGVTHVVTDMGAGVLNRSPLNNEWLLQGNYFDLGLGYWSSAEPDSALAQIAGIDPFYDPALGSLFNSVARSNGAAPNNARPYRGVGNQSMPTTSIDAAGNLYVIYAGVVRGTSNGGDTTGQPFRDLYLLKGNNVGGGVLKWNKPIDISRYKGSVASAGGAALNLVESVYPSAAPIIHNDNKLHYQWMSDGEPGVALDEDPSVENAIMYDAIDLATAPFELLPDSIQPTSLAPRGGFIPFVTVGLPEAAAAYVSSLSAAPNPTTGITTLNLTLRQDARATIVVRNVLGQEVLRVPATGYKAGSSTVRLDLSGQSAGVYTYTVSADKFSLTKRIVKQ